MEIRLPEIAGRDSEITITKWHADAGDSVSAGDDLLEVVADKATFDVPSPCSGKIKDIIKKEGDIVFAGEIISEIEEEET